MGSYIPVKYEKHLCYAMQASVILDFNHTNNRGPSTAPQLCHSVTVNQERAGHITKSRTTEASQKYTQDK